MLKLCLFNKRTDPEPSPGLFVYNICMKLKDKFRKSYYVFRRLPERVEDKMTATNKEKVQPPLIYYRKHVQYHAWASGTEAKCQGICQESNVLVREKKNYFHI
jgi:hypothetical protein